MTNTETWSNSWATQPNPLDAMSRDECLIAWDKAKKAVETAKEYEMKLRKHIVAKAFPTPEEGTNNLDLGNGYTLKAVVNFNYDLAENEIVDSTLDEIAKVGNEGPFIADRLVSWTPNFKLSEFRIIQEEAEKGNKFYIKILELCHKMLVIKDKAPTLKIAEPKKK